jgi:type I restriction enzyme, S subunit
MARDLIPTQVANLIERGVLAINDGYRAKNSELAKTGLPFARGGNIDGGFYFEDADRFPEESLDRVGEKVSRPGDAVFTSKGTVGRFAFVTEDIPRFVYSPQLCFWRSLDRDVVDPRWLFYWMHSSEFFDQYWGVKSQTDMADYVSLRDQRRMQITVPDVVEQRDIAEVLGALDDKIILNQRTNQTLEAIARAIFKAWFLDFYPVIAKSQGRQSFGVDTETAGLFPDSLHDSPLGPIPSGWSVGPILDHAELLSGGTPKTSVTEYWGGDVAWASAADVSGSGEAFLIQSSRSITQMGLRESSTRIIPANATVIVARGATTGRLCMFGREMAMNQTCYALKSRDELPFFLYCLCRASIEDIVHMAYGSVFDTITTRTFGDSKVIIPTPEVTTRFEEIVRPMFEAILSQQLQSAALKTARDALLPKLFSGTISVHSTERVDDGQ